MKIQSIQNEKIKQWTKLHLKKERDKMQRFLIEGEHLIQEALKVGCVEYLLIREDKYNIFDFDQIIECSKDVIDKLSKNVSDVDYIAICFMKEPQTIVGTRILLLDNIQDPGNLGTIIRTAHSFGFEGIYCSNDCVDVYNDKTIRSTQGAMFQLPIVRVDLLKQIDLLKCDGFTVIGTSLHNSIGFEQCKSSEKMAFIFGNEGQGVREELLNLTSLNIKIEMNEFDSLNVAIAAGICMYKFRKC